MGAQEDSGHVRTGPERRPQNEAGLASSSAWESSACRAVGSRLPCVSAPRMVCIMAG